jgi:hypothetical protein
VRGPRRNDPDAFLAIVFPLCINDRNRSDLGNCSNHAVANFVVFPPRGFLKTVLIEEHQQRDGEGEPLP